MNKVEDTNIMVDELKIALAWAESLLAQYADLYDFSCVSYFTLDRAAIIQETNQSGAELLKVAQDSLPGRSFSDFVQTEARLAFVSYLASVFGSRVNRKTEIDAVSDNGEALIVSIEGKMANNKKECRLAIMDITSQKRTEDDLRFLTIFDPLTGLHNRGFFQEEMARFQAGREFPVSLMMVDVDNLKQINDEQGHAAGDAVLRRVGRLLKSAFRGEDIVARIGGDEFAIILPNSDVAATEESVHRVEYILSEDNIRHKSVPISICTGIGTATCRRSLSDLLHEADRMMYEAKSTAKKSP